MSAWRNRPHKRGCTGTLYWMVRPGECLSLMFGDKGARTGMGGRRYIRLTCNAAYAGCKAEVRISLGDIHRYITALTGIR